MTPFLIAAAVDESEKLLGYCGGPLPHEAVLDQLPKFFFSFEFLRALGLCSKAMLLRFRTAELWQSQLIDMQIPEFMHHAPTIRLASTLCRMAQNIIFDQPQLACLRSVPLSALIRWEVEPLRHHSANSFGLVSSHSLLGTARFYLNVGVEVRAVVLGVQSTDGRRQVYCKVHEAFTNRMCASFRVPGAGSSTAQVLPIDFLLPGQRNEIAMLWTYHCFSVQVNRRLLGTVRWNAEDLSGPGVQARVFVRALNPKRVLRRRRPCVTLQTLPTPVLASEKLCCDVCQQIYSLPAQHWCVCPGCFTWLCARHVAQCPGALCPQCPLSYGDYIGGSAPSSRQSSERMQASFADALMVLSMDYAGGKDVPECAADFLDAWPEAQLRIPADVEGVRLAAPVPVRAFNLTVPLAELAELDEVEAQDTQDSDEEASLGFWDASANWLARARAAQMHTRPRSSSSSSSNSSSSEYCGGARPPEDVLRLIATCFFSMDLLGILAACCRDMRQAAADPRLWRNMHIYVDLPEFASAQALRLSSRLWNLATSVTLGIPQLAQLACPPLNGLVNWTAERLRLPGTNVSGFVSQHALLGGCRFRMRLPRAAATVWIGTKELHSNERVLCRLEQPLSNQPMCFFGKTGSPAVPLLRASIADVLTPLQQTCQVVMRWDYRVFCIQLNDRRVATARLRGDVEDGPGPVANAFVWVVCDSAARAHAAMELTPLPSPILYNATITCGLCGRRRSLLQPQPHWAVCPLCATWICSGHVERAPGRRCPNCVMQLCDYIGGSSSSSSNADCISPAEWLRLSLSRAEAIQKRLQLQGQVDMGLHEQWMIGMSPQCCRSYGKQTSQIRLPLP